MSHRADQRAAQQIENPTGTISDQVLDLRQISSVLPLLRTGAMPGLGAQKWSSRRVLSRARVTHSLRPMTEGTCPQSGTSSACPTSPSWRPGCSWPATECARMCTRQHAAPGRSRPRCLHAGSYSAWAIDGNVRTAARINRLCRYERQPRLAGKRYKIEPSRPVQQSLTGIGDRGRLAGASDR